MNTPTKRRWWMEPLERHAVFVACAVYYESLANAGEARRAGCAEVNEARTASAACNLQRLLGPDGLRDLLETLGEYNQAPAVIAADFRKRAADALLPCVCP